MSTQEWTDLVGCLTDGMEAPYGLLTLDDAIRAGSVGNDQDARGRRRLRILLEALVTDAEELASVLGEEAARRGEPLVGLLPTAAGSRPDAFCTWRAAAGRRFVASTRPMPTIVSADARFSTFVSPVRCAEIDAPPEGWS